MPTPPEETMKRLLIAAIVVLAAPTALAAPPPGQSSSSSQACREQRAAIGMNAFRLLYAPTGTPKAAMAECVSRQAPLVAQEEKNAAKTCAAERGSTEATIAAFNLKYGTNPNKKNAFGKCVSSTAEAEVEEQQQATINAAKQCKTERGMTSASITAFNTKYGTNTNKKNAFGKCVSKVARGLTS
jgi:hypothetical protein